MEKIVALNLTELNSQLLTCEPAFCHCVITIRGDICPNDEKTQEARMK